MEYTLTLAQRTVLTVALRTAAAEYHKISDMPALAGSDLQGELKQQAIDALNLAQILEDVTVISFEQIPSKPVQSETGKKRSTSAGEA